MTFIGLAGVLLAIFVAFILLVIVGAFMVYVDEVLGREGIAIAAMILLGLPIVMGTGGHIFGFMPYEKQYNIYQTTSMQAITDGTGFHGYIGLFGGSVDSDARYRYYTRDGDILKLHEVEADDVELHEVEGLKNPRIEQRIGCRLERQWLGWCVTDNRESKEFRIYVPAGSVTTKIDLELNP